MKVALNQWSPLTNTSHHASNALTSSWTWQWMQAHWRRQCLRIGCPNHCRIRPKRWGTLAGQHVDQRWFPMRRSGASVSVKLYQNCKCPLTRAFPFQCNLIFLLPPRNQTGTRACKNLVKWLQELKARDLHFKWKWRNLRFLNSAGQLAILNHVLGCVRPNACDSLFRITISPLAYAKVGRLSFLPVTSASRSISHFLWYAPPHSPFLRISHSLTQC